MNRTKLTPFVKKRIVELIVMGVPTGRAAVAVGVTHQCFNRWRHRGENPDNGHDDIYVQLVQELEQAKARFIERNVARIDKGADKNSEDAKWLLERRDPGEYGKRVEIEVGPSKVLLALQERANKALPAREKIAQGEAIDIEATEVIE